MRLLFAAAGFLFASIVGFAQPLQIYTEIAAPWQGQDSGGKATGPAVEVVKEIQRRVGNSDPIQVVPWARGLAAAQSEPNVVLFLMARTAERNALFQWVGPIVEGIYGLYVKADSRMVLKSLEDAKRLGKIGVYQGDARDQILTQAGFTNLERAPSSDMSMKMLMAGRIDAIASSDYGIAGLAESAGYTVRDVRLALRFFKFQDWIAFSKGTPAATVKDWAAALAAIRTSGVLAEIIRKDIPSWTPPGPAITTF